MPVPWVRRIPAAGTASSDPENARVTFHPKKRATNALAGWRQTSAGAPTCSMWPSCITTSRSASANASSWSWVTNRMVRPSLTNSARSSVTIRSRSALVECAERFVEHEQPWGRRQRAREGDPLLFTAGELGNASMLESIHADERQRLARPRRSSSVARDTLHAQPEGDVAEDVAVGEQRVILEHQAEAAFVGRHLLEIDTVPRDVPGGVGFQSGDRPEQGALAATARPEDAHDLPVGDDEIEAVDRGEAVVGHGHVVETEHQNVPTDPTRKRSMARMANAVSAIRITLAAMAPPKF